MSTPGLPKEIKNWRKEVEQLSYEEALTALDLLLAELQNDAVPMAELQRHYQRGQVYLDHCERLLQSAEQSVIQLNPQTLTPLDDA